MIDMGGWGGVGVEGGVVEESFKYECGWVHMMEVCLGGNWVYAWDGPWRLSGKVLRWIRAGRCGWVFGWKFPDGPRLGNLDGSVVRN